MKLIATQTLTSDQPNITFTSIPQNFTDLVLFISGRTDRALEGDGFSLRFNGNQSGYSQRRLIGAGSGSPSSDTQLNSFFTTANNATANTFGNSSIYIPNYAGNANKSYSNDGVSENNAATSYAGINAGVWSNTAAINSITLTPEGGTVFRANTTASLYGIGGTGNGWAPKATGGTISKIDGYYVHTFTASGTFTPLEPLNVEYLVVAGGGGAGDANNNGGGGGGGGGGYRTSVVGATSGANSSAEPQLALTSATNYTVTVGAGGPKEANGSNSVFSTITSLGGGRGGQRFAFGEGQTPSIGGSGGAGGQNDPVMVGAAGTANQGFAGGNGSTDGSGGGGGGAGAAGNSPSGGGRADGGSGISSSINGVATFYAGGGGGGNNRSSATAGDRSLGGAGGGGAGGNQFAGQSGVAGSANTGGGGGSSINGLTAGLPGGSGIVIVRYAA